MSRRSAFEALNPRPVVFPLLYMASGFLLAFLFILWYPKPAGKLLHILASFFR